MPPKNIIRVAIAAAVSALAALAIASSPAAAQYPTTNQVQAPGNAAGVIFHPRGDCFEIWDNVADNAAVWVSWNYVGVDDSIKREFSWRGQKTTLQCPNMKEGEQIYFRVTGRTSRGDVVKSAIVKYRTHGS